MTGGAAALAALARAIDRAATVKDAAAIRNDAAALRLPSGREPALPLDVLARYAPADLRAHLWAQFAGPLESTAGPILCRHLLAVIADPSAGAPDAVTTAEALAGLLRRRGRGHSPLQGTLDHTAAALADQARRATDHLRELLDSNDFPDLRSISFDLLRVEGVRWVLEILGQRPALAALSEHGRRLSRLTLKRSAVTIRNFIGKPDLLALYDNIAIVSQVDNLLTVAARLLDALKDKEEERTHFVTPDDETALCDFGAALIDLAAMLARIAAKSAGRTDVSPGLAVTTLEQLTFLHQFSKRLGADHPAEFTTLEQDLRRHALAIAKRFEAAVEASPLVVAAGSIHPLETQARALSGLLSAMNLDGAAACIQAMAVSPA